MTALTIHCGSFKTGSSRIQNHAWAQRAALASAGWLYPETGVYRREPEVGHRHSALAYGDAQGAKWPALVERLIGEIRAAAPAHVLLSCEAWSNRNQIPSLGALRARLHTAGCADESHAIIYLRNRADYLRSHYREFTRRRGNTLPFGDYVRGRMAAIDPPGVLGALREIFSDRIGIIAYEQAGEIGNHFFSSLGLPPPGTASGETVNPGLDALETEARRVMNRLAPHRRTGFPGLAVIAARAGVAIGTGDPTEAFPPGVLDVDRHWIERFRTLSGWADAEIDALLARRTMDAPDVTEWAPVVERLCGQWLASNPLPRRFHVEQFGHPAVVVAAIDVFPNGGEDSKLGGYVVLAATPGAGLDLLAEDASGSLPLTWRIPSARIAARYPAEPSAARARFAIPVHGMDRAEGFVQLSLANGTGQRTPIIRITPGSE